jgi:hypothetical protein
MKILRSLVAALVGGVAVKASQPAPEKGSAEAMREMRVAWLKTVPEADSYKTKDDVVAVVMDWPMGDVTVSVLSSSGGDASIYTTSTFGVLGGIGHEKVRNAAITFVSTAQRFLELTAPTKEFPYPDKVTLRFYMVTAGGVRTVSFPMKDIERGDSPAYKLYRAAQNVVTELRLITPNQK